MTGRSAIESTDGRCDGTSPTSENSPSTASAASDDRAEHDGDEQRGEPAAVDLAVVRDDRRDQQVGEEERDDAGERDAARPQHGGERHVADRADERERGDDRPDDTFSAIRSGAGASVTKSPLKKSIGRSAT